MPAPRSTCTRVCDTALTSVEASSQSEARTRASASPGWGLWLRRQEANEGQCLALCNPPPGPAELPFCFGLQRRRNGGGKQGAEGRSRGQVGVYVTPLPSGSRLPAPNRIAPTFSLVCCFRPKSSDGTPIIHLPLPMSTPAQPPWDPGVVPCNPAPAVCIHDPLSLPYLTLPHLLPTLSPPCSVPSSGPTPDPQQE